MSLIDKSNLLEHYENGRLDSYKSFSIDSPNTFNFCDIEKKPVGGLPLVSYRKGGNLQVTFTENTHALVIGATRSGKTTSFIIPTILLKSKQKQKDNMLITDPKGELYKKCAESLRAEGYKIVLLNFRDYNNSECWNPLTPIFRKYQEMANIEKGISTLKDKGKYFSTFNKKVFHSQKELNREVERERDVLYKSVQEEIDNLAHEMITVENKRDPYWELSSKELFKAFVYAMLEDSVDDNCSRPKITEDNFSFRTILDIYDTFYFGGCDINDGGYFSKRPANSKAYALAKATMLDNAQNTRMCILSVFESKMAPYRDIVANLITSCNTFDLGSLILENKPVAVFICYRDEIKTSYFVIQQYIVSVYTKLIELANLNKELSLARPFYFILDEFGNFPAIQDFENTISACGSRNIWFVLVLQSYAQLYNVYDSNIGEIIKDNLNMHIFMGTNNPLTKKAFSEECGYKTIISPMSALNGEGVTQENFQKETVSLIPISKLNYFEEGECVITRTNAKTVLWSKLERSYLCPEFECKQADVKDYKISIDLFDKKYNYKVQFDDDDDSFIF